MTYQRISNFSNTTGTTRGAQSAYPSGVLEISPILVGFVLLTPLLFFLLWSMHCVLNRGWTEVCRHIYSPHVTIMSCR